MQLTDDEILAACSACPQLRVLGLGGLKNLTEKTLRMELEQATTQLQGLKELSEGADTQVRLITSKFEEKQRERQADRRLDGARNAHADYSYS